MVFEHLQQDLANVNACKTMFDPYIAVVSKADSNYPVIGLSDVCIYEHCWLEPFIWNALCNYSFCS